LQRGFGRISPGKVLRLYFAVGEFETRNVVSGKGFRREQQLSKIHVTGKGLGQNYNMISEMSGGKGGKGVFGRWER
jgi:hypothetical protein